MESTETHPDRLIDFWEWLVENRMQVILAIIIAIVAVLIVYTQRVNAKLAEEESGEDVLAATDQRFSTDQVNPNATASERFGNVALNHPGTAGANNAKFLQASALFDEGKYKEADAAFAGYVSENPLSPLVAAAALGQAASKASLGDSGAAAAYESVRNQYIRGRAGHASAGPNGAGSEECTQGARITHIRFHQPRVTILGHDRR